MCIYAIPTVPFIHNTSIAEQLEIEKLTHVCLSRERDGEEKSRISSLYRKGRIAKILVKESQAQTPQHHVI